MLILVSAILKKILLFVMSFWDYHSDKIIFGVFKVTIIYMNYCRLFSKLPFCKFLHAYPRLQNVVSQEGGS